MGIFGHLFSAIGTVLDLVLAAYMWIVIISAVLSWVRPDPRNPAVRFIRDVTEPVFLRVRRLIPLDFGGIDFSPMLVLIAIVFIRRLLASSMY